MRPFTTLARIRAASPCEEGWKKLTKALGGIAKYGEDTPITVRQIIESNGLDYALWCLRTMPEHGNLWRNYAVDCAEQVKHLMADPRSLNALVVARNFADGNATEAELDAAWAAAWAAAGAAAWAAAGAAAGEWQKNRLIFLCEKEG